MEMWNWLQPWWNWWAGFTDLFDWNAIAAVATAAAVFVALDQSTKSQRLANRRNAAVAADLIAMFEPIVESFFHDDNGYLDPVSLQSLAASDLFKRAETGVKRHDPISIREAGISVSAEYMLDTLRNVQEGAFRSLWADKGSGPPSFAWLADLDHIWAELRMVRARLQHGRFVLAVQRLLRPGWFDAEGRAFSPGHLGDL